MELLLQPNLMVVAPSHRINHQVEATPQSDSFFHFELGTHLFLQKFAAKLEILLIRQAPALALLSFLPLEIPLAFQFASLLVFTLLALPWAFPHSSPAELPKTLAYHS